MLAVAVNVSQLMIKGCGTLFSYFVANSTYPEAQVAASLQSVSLEQVIALAVSVYGAHLVKSQHKPSILLHV